MTTRVCRLCRIPKELDDFPLNKRCEGGRRHECRECDNEYKREWNREQRAKLRATKTEEERRARDREYNRLWMQRKRAEERAVEAGDNGGPWNRDPERVLSVLSATPAERDAVELAAAQMLEGENSASAPGPKSGLHICGWTTLDRLGPMPVTRWANLAAAAIYRAEQLRGRPCVLDQERRQESERERRTARREAA
jgi:hypothetical protein